MQVCETGPGFGRGFFLCIQHRNGFAVSEIVCYGCKQPERDFQVNWESAIAELDNIITALREWKV
jgi:hypothetical protein